MVIIYLIEFWFFFGEVGDVIVFRGCLLNLCVNECVYFDVNYI